MSIVNQNNKNPLDLSIINNEIEKIKKLLIDLQSKDEKVDKTLTDIQSNLNNMKFDLGNVPIDLGKKNS